MTDLISQFSTVDVCDIGRPITNYKKNLIKIHNKSKYIVPSLVKSSSPLSANIST